MCDSPTEKVNDLLNRIIPLKKIALSKIGNINDIGLRKTIGRNIKEAIKQMGVSQKEFARKLGVAPETLSAYVNGRVLETFTKLFEIAKLTSKDVRWFFETEEYRKHIDFLETYWKETHK